jgi:hypothetical protein
MSPRTSNSGIISTSDAGLWRDLVVSSSAPDVYFLPEYLGFFERWGEGEALLFFYQDNGNTLLYPFLRRPLPELKDLETVSRRHCDVSTAYGYGGPLVSMQGDDPDFVSRARSHLETLFEQMGVVTEFVRFHPLLENHLVWQTIPTEFVQKTVAIDLSGPQDTLWEQMNSNTRRKVRSSFNHDLEVEISHAPDEYAQFWSLYTSTMERLQATEYYRFSLEYVLGVGEVLGENAMSCIVRHRGRPAAAGIFLKYGPFLHYHLGGSDEELLPLRPNDRMFFEMACWGMANLARLFHLGGGYRANDSLFRFKTGFSKDLRDFHVGKIVNDEEMNAVLTKARLRTGKPPPATDFFPAYRA